MDRNTVTVHTQTQEPTTEEREVIKMADGEEKNVLAAVISLMAAIIALGSIGNILVITAVAKTKKLQMVTNIFVANMSMCDLMFVTLVLPVNMYTYLGDGWLVPATLCKCIGFLSYTLTGTAIMTITLIAWTRFTLVVTARNYNQMFRPRNIGIMLVATWIMPAVSLLPAVLGAWGNFGYIPMLSNCNLELDSSSQSFKIFLLIIRAAIPCGLIVYFYGAIYVTTRESHKRIDHMSTACSIMKHNNHMREMKLTQMMICIFMIFVISYFPCTISSVIDYSRLLSKTFHMFCQTSVFLGSAVNPILYGLMNEQFRCAYFHILKCNMAYRPKVKMHVMCLDEGKSHALHCKYKHKYTNIPYLYTTV